MTCHSLRWLSGVTLCGVTAMDGKQQWQDCWVFCDHTVGNGEKVMVLNLHDSAPIQVKLNYIEDKAYPRLKELGGKMSRSFSVEGGKLIKFVRLSQKNNLLKLTINPKIKRKLKFKLLDREAHKFQD